MIAHSEMSEQHTFQIVVILFRSQKNVEDLYSMHQICSIIQIANFDFPSPA